jgi:hypothetical protein
VPFARGIEVQVLENEYGNTKSYSTHGDIFPIHGASMVPDHGRGGDRSFPTENLSKPAGNWNRYIIVCDNGAIKLSVNGKFVNGGTECNYRKGYICLESEGSECHFRNLKIKELPASGADASNTAPLVEGFTSLYSGLDLRGWKTNDDVEKIWKSRDWQLACSPVEGKRSDLVSGKNYGSYSVQLDYKWNGKEPDLARSPIVFGGDESWGLKTIPDEMKSALEKIPPGAFRRLRIDRGLSTQTVTLNGRVIAKQLPIERDPKENFSLRDSGQAATFASIYVLEHQ